MSVGPWKQMIIGPYFETNRNARRFHIKQIGRCSAKVCVRARRGSKEEHCQTYNKQWRIKRLRANYQKGEKGVKCQMVGSLNRFSLHDVLQKGWGANGGVALIGSSDGGAEGADTSEDPNLTTCFFPGCIRMGEWGYPGKSSSTHPLTMLASFDYTSILWLYY